MEESVKLGESGGGLGVNEGGPPAVGAEEGDEIEFDLRFDLGPEHAAVGVSSLPADVVEGRARTERLEHLGGGEGVGVGDFAVVLLGNLRGGDAKTEEASVDGVEGFLDGGVIQEIFVDVGTQLGIGVHERAAGDGADFVDDGGGEAGFKDGVACGTGGTEEEDFHQRRVYMNGPALRQAGQ
jgi:hypothetical protein